MTLVVAGNWTQFRNWQERDHERRKEARYVLSWRDLQGWPMDTKVLFVGTYYTRGDIGTVTEYVADMRFPVVFESVLNPKATR